MSGYLAPAPYATAPLGRPLARDIIAGIARKHGISVEDLTGPERRREFSWPRQEAMFWIRERTKLSTPQIGQLLGNRDHTTVLHGISAHEARANSQAANFGVESRVTRTRAEEEHASIRA